MLLIFDVFGNNSTFQNNSNVVCEYSVCTNPMVETIFCFDECFSQATEVEITSISYPSFTCGFDMIGNCFTYKPLPGFENISDNMSLVVEDENDTTYEISISIGVYDDCPSIPLVANIDEVVTIVNNNYIIDVLANDIDENGESIEILNHSQPVNGMVSLEDQKLLYTPNDDFVGMDVFSYTIINSSGSIATTGVKVWVRSINLCEFTNCYHAINSSNPDFTYFCLDEICNIDLANAELISSSTKYRCALSVDQDFTVQYAPLPLMTEDDYINIVVSIDSDIFEINIDLLFDEDCIHNFDDCNLEKSYCEYDACVDAYSKTVFCFEECFDNPEKVEIISAESTGNCILEHINNCVVYTSLINIPQVDTVSIIAKDETLLYNIDILFNVQDDCTLSSGLVANNDSLVTSIGVPVAIEVLTNDIDFDGESFAVSDYTNPSNGSIEFLSLDQSFTYTPESDFVGEDFFEYTITNSNGITAKAIARIIVLSDNLCENTICTEADFTASFFVCLDELCGLDAESNEIVAVIANFDCSYEIAGTSICILYHPIPFIFDNGEDMITIFAEQDGEITVANITIEFENECEEIEEDYVWPGDANADGWVNNFDILAIGLSYENEGPERPNASVTWIPQPAFDWDTETQLTSSVDYEQYWVNDKHIDCNGDGIINDGDSQVIDFNYNKSHGKNNEFPYQQTDLNNAILSIEIQNEIISAGSFVTADINLTMPDESLVENVYGIAFSIDYANFVNGMSIIQDGSIDLTMNILGNETNSIKLVKELNEEQRLDIGFTRTDSQSVSGSGTIATLTFQMVENISENISENIQELSLNIENVVMNNETGNIIPLNPENDTAEIITSNHHTLAPITYSVFPNPVKDHLHIDIDNTEIEEIRIYDTFGKIVFESNSFFADNFIDIQFLNSGIYFLTFKTIGGETLSRKIKKVE